MEGIRREGDKGKERTRRGQERGERELARWCGKTLERE